jgi:hypothetical protein
MQCMHVFLFSVHAILLDQSVRSSICGMLVTYLAMVNYLESFATYSEFLRLICSCVGAMRMHQLSTSTFLHVPRIAIEKIGSFAVYSVQFMPILSSV